MFYIVYRSLFHKVLARIEDGVDELGRPSLKIWVLLLLFYRGRPNSIGYKDCAKCRENYSDIQMSLALLEFWSRTHVCEGPKFSWYCMNLEDSQSGVPVQAVRCRAWWSRPEHGMIISIGSGYLYIVWSFLECLFPYS